VGNFFQQQDARRVDAVVVGDEQAVAGKRFGRSHGAERSLGQTVEAGY